MMKRDRSSRAGGGRARMPAARPRATDDPVAAGLRRLWADLESEPVPDSFLDLLDRIDAAREEGGGGDAGETGSHDGGSATAEAAAARRP